MDLTVCLQKVDALKLHDSRETSIADIISCESCKKLCDDGSIYSNRLEDSDLCGDCAAKLGDDELRKRRLTLFHDGKRQLDNSWAKYPTTSSCSMAALCVNALPQRELDKLQYNPSDQALTGWVQLMERLFQEDDLFIHFEPNTYTFGNVRGWVPVTFNKGCDLSDLDNLKKELDQDEVDELTLMGAEPEYFSKYLYVLDTIVALDCNADAPSGRLAQFAYNPISKVIVAQEGQHITLSSRLHGQHIIGDFYGKLMYIGKGLTGRCLCIPDCIPLANGYVAQDYDGCGSYTCDLPVPDIVMSAFDNWDSLEGNALMAVKQELVAMIPQLAPVDTLKMSVGDDGQGHKTFFFFDRLFECAILFQNEAKIWFLDRNSEFEMPSLNEL